MKKIVLALVMLVTCIQMTMAQERRPVDNLHPLWFVHIDVWNKADPQKIIDLIPSKIRPYVCLNLSLSCGYDIDRGYHRMPENAIMTYRSWATIAQRNGMWFSCQPASGGHSHLFDSELETYEYFFKNYPNFLGWNFAEQFWGFDEINDKYSASLPQRIELFAKLVEMSHNYGGFLTVSFCGNIWSHPLNPVGMLKSSPNFMEACKKYPEAILWLYKYTTSSCFYNNESVSFGPFVAGLAKNYGVRYDNCGWNGALDNVFGEGHGKKYPSAAGIGTIMEQTCQNGGAVWDGPELIWTEDFENLPDSKDAQGYTVRNWGTFKGFDNVWLDMFNKILDGTMYIPSREEVVANTKIAIINDVTSGDHENRFATWGDLYDGLYKQNDPFNIGNGQWMNNCLYLKKTGRYNTIPLVPELYDDLAKTIPVQVNKSKRGTVWPNQTAKVNAYNAQYPAISEGDLFVSRHRNQLVTYTPYSYVNTKKIATATIPLQYNTCESMELKWGKLSSAIVREYTDSISFYMNNYRMDTTTQVADVIVLNGVKAKPTYKFKRRVNATGTAAEEWDESTGTYTLTVRHLGPVDVCINASGNATDRLTDMMFPQPLEKPKQPAAYTGMIIKEAEDLARLNTGSCVTDPFNLRQNIHGHSGNGFVEMGTNTAAALKGIFNVTARKNYKIGFRYLCTAGETKMKLALGTTSREVKCPQSGENEWRTVFADGNFASNGTNAIVILTNTGGKQILIDQVVVMPSTMEQEKYPILFQEAAHGTASASVDAAVEGDTIQLTATPEAGYKHIGWEILRGRININEDGTFRMPYDPVLLKPVFQKDNMVYELNIHNALTGTLPEGWVAKMNSTDSHSYPEVYASGPRVMSGFHGEYERALYWTGFRAYYGKLDNYPLYLEKGKYIAKAKCAAWKSSPTFKIAIFDGAETKLVASSNVNYCSPCAYGEKVQVDISSSPEVELEFEITTPARYLAGVNSGGSGSGDERLLLAFSIEKKIDPVNILTIDADEEVDPKQCKIYSADGKLLPTVQRGYNVVVYPNGKTRTFWVK